MVLVEYRLLTSCVLVVSVRFIRMRKQIHDCNTAVNGSVMQ
jgi:hypothetical protein